MFCVKLYFLVGSSEPFPFCATHLKCRRFLGMQGVVTIVGIYILWYVWFFSIDLSCLNLPYPSLLPDLWVCERLCRQITSSESLCSFSACLLVLCRWLSGHTWLLSINWAEHSIRWIQSIKLQPSWWLFSVLLWVLCIRDSFLLAAYCGTIAASISSVTWSLYGGHGYYGITTSLSSCCSPSVF